MFGNYYQGKVVFVTGHTGFKGSWLCEWLLLMGAKVHGYSNAIDQKPSLFETLELEKRVGHEPGDVRDFADLSARIKRIRPDLVFHLAAQPLVRRSYRDPVETIATNVMGTVNLLECIRGVDWPVVAVIVTSDKCYENREIPFGYREIDPLGGHDPYSASKGAAELLFHAYRRSFFGTGKCVAKIASARAGNVIGGGDWSEDRLVPDAVRSLARAETVPLRNPKATRPWQHVLEPLAGYLTLAWNLGASKLIDPFEPKTQSHSSFNFGPQLEANRSVRDLVEEMFKSWPGEWRDLSDPHAPHEAGLLNLAIDKAHHLLRWKPVLDFSVAVKMTTEWYRAYFSGGDAQQLTHKQILEYINQSKQHGLEWSSGD